MSTSPFRVSRIAHHSLIYGIGVVASKAVSFLTLPIYTRYLTPSDYGVLQLITLTHEVLSILAGVRIARGIFHFYHKAQTPEERRAVLSTSLALLAATFTVVAFGTYVTAPYIADVIFDARGSYVLYVRLAAAGLAFESLVLVPVTYLQLRHRSKLFVGVNLAKLVLQVGLNVILLIPFRMGVLGVLISTLATTALFGSGLALYLVREVGIRLSSRAARDLLRFGLPLVGMQVASVFLTFGDRYFLNKAADTAAVGLYGLAYQFGFLLLTLAYLPFGRVWDPMRFEIARRPDRDDVYSRVFLYINIVLITTALLISLFVKDFLLIIAHSSFHSAATLVPVIVVAYLLQAWMVFLNLGIFISEKTEYFTLATWIAAGVAALGYVWLIPLWGAWGAAITTVVAFTVRLWVVYVAGQRLWPIQYRWAPVVKLLGLATPVCIAAALLPNTSVATSLLIRVVLFGLYALALWFSNILSDYERHVVRRLVRSPRAAVSAFIG